MSDFVIACIDSRAESDGTLYSRYLMGPFARGHATTLASALRRSLLSDIPGLAITEVTIEGVEHEYSIIPETHETVLDLLLALKKLVFSSPILPPEGTAIGYITARGPGTITGKDLRLPPGFQCATPDQHLATVTTDGVVNFKVRIAAGKGFLRQSSHRAQSEAKEQPYAYSNNHVVVSTFPVDAVFMPVKNATFSVRSNEDILAYPLGIESYKVSERIIFEIQTNGTLSPREALGLAAKALIRTISPFLLPEAPEPQLKRKVHSLAHKAEMARSGRHTLQPVYTPNFFVDLDIGILPLNPSAFIAFKERNMDRIQDLLHHSFEDLLNISGMTPDSLFTVLCYLRSYGIQLQPEVQPAVS